MNDASLQQLTAMRAFAEFNVEALYLRPTRTGLDKSIMDAHKEVRNGLKDMGIHDYSSQGQGRKEKVKYPVRMLHADWEERRFVSLYRPQTKAGDPRIWISELHTYAKAGDVIALLIDRQGQLVAVNCERPEILESRHHSGSPLNGVLTSSEANPAAGALLDLLREISSRGYIKSTHRGDFAVGRTLEAALNIKPNSLPYPDFQETIEVKARRTRSNSNDHLFSVTPTIWRENEGSGAAKTRLINDHGYLDKEGRPALRVTVGPEPNRQGLFLETCADGVWVQMFHESDSNPIASWSLEILAERLRQKHPETFWVSADSQRDISGNEEFHFTTALYTKLREGLNLGRLITGGHIILDLTMHIKEDDKLRCHGFLWKASNQSVRARIFSPPEKFDLRSST